jgi:hypothetical protein
MRGVTAPELHVIQVEQQDPRLGRQVVHDPRSRRFVAPVTVDRSTWRSKALRVYDPAVNPNQPVGCCTGVSKAIQLNTAGHRKAGRVLGMPAALDLYRRATVLDPWEGSWEPDDTGSSGLAAAKAAQEQLGAGEYRWLFGGADEVVQAVMAGWPVSVGTWWYAGMFNLDAKGRTGVTGARVGGHQWTVRGYDLKADTVIGRCWWGSFRDFTLSRGDLAGLLADDGDAHVQEVSP